MVPLNLAIDRYGAAPLAGDRQFTLAAVGADGGEAGLEATVLEEAFALGQYLAMSDDEKLSRPSFEGQQAGLGLGTDQVGYAYDAATDGALEYETLQLVPGQAAIRRSGNARYRSLLQVA